MMRAVSLIRLMRVNLPDELTLYTNAVSHSLAQIEPTCGFLEAAQRSAAWIRRMRKRALFLEAHHMTHIEGTTLTLGQAEQLLAG